MNDQANHTLGDKLITILVPKALVKDSPDEDHLRNCREFV